MSSGAGEAFRGAASAAKDAVELVSRSRDRRPGSARPAVPIMPWDNFLAQFKWIQGEHVTLLGTTGSGKTTLAIELLKFRRYKVAFGTKAKDSTFSQLLKEGYRRIYSWEPQPTIDAYALWPDISKLDAREVMSHQKEVFGFAMNSIYKSGGYCIFLDELRYITDVLKLDMEYELLMQQGRSLGISVIGGTQRPRFIPLVAYDQATHLFFWRENDRENIKRLGGLGGTDSAEIEAIISNLPEKTFLYLNTRTGEKIVSKVQLHGGK